MGPYARGPLRATALRAHVLRRHWYDVKPIMTLPIKQYFQSWMSWHTLSPVSKRVP